MPFKKTMSPYRLRFVVLLLASLTLTMEAAHVLELPQKMSYSPELYAAVNSTMYRYFALVGGPLTVLMLLIGAALVVASRHRAAFRWTFVGVAAYYVAFAVWLAVVAPVNRTVAAAAARDPASLPQLWMALRVRWESGHALGFILEFLGFVSLLCSVFTAHPIPDPKAQPNRIDPGR